MNQFSDLLIRAASEARSFKSTSRDPSAFETEWLSRFALQLEGAALLPAAQVDRAVQALARQLVDSGPLATEFSPSFDAVLGAAQRKTK